jgi:hypothetical protein
VRALALAALTVILCACGARHPAEEAADEKTVAFEGLSLRVPPGWDSYSDDIGPWMPEPEIWAANVSLPERASGMLAAPYEVLPDLPRRGIVLVVMAPAGPCAFKPSLHVEPVDILDGGYEGQPAPHVATWSTSGVRNGRCVWAQAWFGVNEPDESMRSEVNRVLASVELEPEHAPGSNPGWRTYRDEKARLALRYPPGWQVSEGRLMPLLTEPRELVSLGTSALRSGDERCPQAPEAAVEALGSTDALISLLEFRSEAHAPPRSKRLLPFEGARAPTCNRLQLPSGFLVRSRSFEDRGRVFQLYVAVGESASDETRRETTEILNSLTVDP